MLNETGCNDIGGGAVESKEDTANEVRSVLIEDFVPYDRSKKWEVHNRFFQLRGSKAWLDGEIPYQITSNSAAAFQKAFLVYSAVVELVRAGELAEDEPIEVLEMASGLGLFAVNFIRGFADLDFQQGTQFSQRLCYYFTDYSKQNLIDASTNPVLNQLRNEGKIKFLVLDALFPTVITDLDGVQGATPSKLCAVFNNYMHCCLPLTILRKYQDCLKQKEIKLALRCHTAADNLEQYATELFENPVGVNILSDLVEEVRYESVTDQLFRSLEHRAIIESVAADYQVATVIYPYGSMQSIEQTVPLIRPGGIMMITDKGYANTEYLAGENQCEPSLHGNTLAHCVNFPALVKYLQNFGSAVQTTDPDLAVQTLFFENRQEQKLVSQFEQAFVRYNSNVERSDFYAAARKYEDEKDWKTAKRFYQRASHTAPFDCSIYFQLGRCCYELAEYQHALESFYKGQAVEVFSQYDFAFQIGISLHRLARYPEAIESYKVSLDRDYSEVTLYNIGLCYEELGKNYSHLAKQYYANSVAKNPNYELALQRYNLLS